MMALIVVEIVIELLSLLAIRDHCNDNELAYEMWCMPGQCDAEGRRPAPLSCEEQHALPPGDPINNLLLTWAQIGVNLY